MSLDGIVGSGPVGRILHEDVLKAASAKPTESVKEVKTPAPKAVKKVEAAPEMTSALYTDIENSNIRKVIADRLTHSK